MADLDEFRIDAAALLNGGGREGRARAYLTAQARRQEAEGKRLERERQQLRGEWRRVMWGWLLLVAATVALGGAWPALLGWADWLWRR